MCINNKSVLCMVIFLICNIIARSILAITVISPGNTLQFSLGHVLRNQRDFENDQSVIENCLKLYPFKDPHDSGSVEECQRIFEENQSNCALKCINDNFNVTQENGVIDVSKIQQMFLDRVDVSSSFLLELTSLMNECERQAAEQIQKQVGGLQENACKYHVLFTDCSSNAYVYSEQEIYKLCQESAKTEKQN